MSNSRHLSFTKMEVARQRASASAHKKEEKEKGKEGASLSAPKVIGKGAPKRKVDGKDNHPSKKVSVTHREK